MLFPRRPLTASERRSAVERARESGPSGRDHRSGTAPAHGETLGPFDIGRPLGGCADAAHTVQVTGSGVPLVVPQEQAGQGVGEVREPAAGRSASALALACNQALAGAHRSEPGSTVVVHEFSHELDTLDGVVDGTPLLARGLRAAWGGVCAQVYDDLVAGVPRPPMR